jgi:hypothetical protein
VSIQPPGRQNLVVDIGPPTWPLRGINPAAQARSQGGSRRCGVPCAFSRRDSLLVEIIWSLATSLRDLPDLDLNSLSAAAMARLGPSGPVTLEPVTLAPPSVTKAGRPVSKR